MANCSEGWCKVPAGTFLMSPLRGCDFSIMPEQKGTTRWVTLTHSFVIMETEVTVASWMNVMGDVFPENPSSQFNCGYDCPVTNITAFDMFEFANRLSAKGGFESCYKLDDCTRTSDGHLDCAKSSFTGYECTGYRLPFEAEWELAAGAGVDMCLPVGFVPMPNGYELPDAATVQALSSFAWACFNCDVQYEGCTAGSAEYPDRCCGNHPVGLLAPNAFGLYDVFGNAGELVHMDWEDVVLPETGLPETDPGASLESPKLGYKGGVWGSCLPKLSIPWRRGQTPVVGNVHGPAWEGIRLVRTIETVL